MPLRRRWRDLDKSAWVWLIAIAVLLLLVVNPLLRLLIASLQQDDTGAFTFANYLAAYSRARYVEALGNSLVLGTSAATLCLLFGVPLAWALSRTDMPGKGLVWVSILGTFIIPPYLGAVGWILLAGPNAGWLNRAAIALTGIDKGPFNIYSMPGLVLVTACYSFPYVFMFTKSALDLVSSEMEDAANILGAGTLRTTLLDHVAAGPARHARCVHPRLSRSDRAVRIAGPARAAGALPRRHDAALAVLRIPAEGRRGSRVRDALAVRHGVAVLACSAASRAARATWP